MSTMGKTLLAIAVLVLSGVGVWRQWDDLPWTGNAEPGGEHSAAAVGVASGRPVLESAEDVVGADGDDVPGREPSVASHTGVEPGIATGRVIDARTKQPVAAAQVVAYLERGVLQERVGTFRTNAEGRFEADLRILMDRPRFVFATGDVILRVRADGYQPALTFASRANEDGLRVWDAVTVQLEPGAVVRGRVLDRSGDPVVGRVTLVSQTSPHRTARGLAGNDGRFEVGVDAGATYVGRVEQENVGTLRILGFHVAAGAVIDLGDLRLMGPGTIEGVLRYPNGRPAAFAKAAAWAVPTDVNEGVTPDAASGLLATRALADEEGHFVLTGLAPGRYYVADAAERPSGAARAQPGPWQRCDTGARDVIVEVRGRRVVIFVKDEAGHPLPGAGYLARWGPDSSAGTVQAASGMLTFRAKPGETLRIAIRAADAGVWEFAFQITAEDFETRRDAVLRSASEATGVIHVASIIDPSGRPIEGATVSLCTRVAGALVRGVYEVPLPSNGRIEDVPAGRFILTVVPGRTKRHRRDERWFPIEQAVEVKPDTVTTVRLDARPGARLRLTVLGVGEVGTRIDRMKAFVEPSTGGAPIRLGAWTVNDPGGGWTRGSARAGRPGLQGRLLEPGAYTLSVRIAGYKPVVRQIRLDALSVLDVEITPEPE